MMIGCRGKGEATGSEEGPGYKGWLLKLKGPTLFHRQPLETQTQSPGELPTSLPARSEDAGSHTNTLPCQKNHSQVQLLLTSCK